MAIILGEGTHIIFLAGVGYKNRKGQIKFDVKSGEKGIIKHVTLSEGQPSYDIELTTSKTITNESVIHNIDANLIHPAQLDIIKPVDDFPKKPKKHKPWRKFSTSQLEAFAIANKVEWKKVENEKVNRMFLVKALIDSGLKAPNTEEELKERIE